MSYGDNKTVYTQISDRLSTESWMDEDFGLDMGNKTDMNVVRYLSLEDALKLRDSLNAHLARF